MATQPRWERTEPAPPLAPVPRSTSSADPDLNPARVLSAIALASIAAGAIHIAAAATLGSVSAQNLAFFAVVAAAQIVWGAVSLARASQWWLALGAIGNLIVLATWIVSRTVGLPVGVYADVALAVGFPDGLAAVLEAVIVLGAAALLLRGQTPARSAVRSPGFTVAIAVLIGALALGGVVSQAGANDSSAGPVSNGGVGGPSTPYAPGGGGGSSAGGYSGGY
jgi:hypothetical protein